MYVLYLNLFIIHTYITYIKLTLTFIIIIRSPFLVKKYQVIISVNHCTCLYFYFNIKYIYLISLINVSNTIINEI